MAIKIYRDGRTKLTGRDYIAHKIKVWERQDKRCAGPCGQYLPLNFAQFDHFAGRGSGGGKRDDLDPRNSVMCYDCHVLAGKRDTDCHGIRRRMKGGDLAAAHS